MTWQRRSCKSQCRVHGGTARGTCGDHSSEYCHMSPRTAAARRHHTASPDTLSSHTGTYASPEAGNPRTPRPGGTPSRTRASHTPAPSRTGSRTGNSARNTLSPPPPSHIGTCKPHALGTAGTGHRGKSQSTCGPYSLTAFYKHCRTKIS